MLFLLQVTLLFVSRSHIYNNLLPLDNEVDDRILCMRQTDSWRKQCLYLEAQWKAVLTHFIDLPFIILRNLKFFCKIHFILFDVGLQSNNYSK
jgi:hypothetical protein